MSDLDAGALEGASQETVSADPAASEATENPQGQPTEAPADAEAEAKAKAEAEETERKTRHQRRMEQIRSAREAEQAAIARAREAEQQAQAIRAAMSARPMPKQEAFANFEDYQSELVARRTLGLLRAEQAEEMLRTAQAERRQVEAAKAATQARENELNYSIREEGVARFPDFLAVATNDAVPLTPGVMRIVHQTDDPAAMAYWLGQNREEAVKIAELVAKGDPDAMAMAGIRIANIQARIAAPKPPPVTAAPEPIAPVRPQSSANVDYTRGSYRDYEAARKAGKI